MTKESKTNNISVAAGNATSCVLCIVWQPGRNDLAPGCFLLVFSLNPQVECSGNQVPVDIVAQFHAGIGM